MTTHQEKLSLINKYAKNTLQDLINYYGLCVWPESIFKNNLFTGPDLLIFEYWPPTVLKNYNVNQFILREKNILPSKNNEWYSANPSLYNTADIENILFVAMTIIHNNKWFCLPGPEILNLCSTVLKISLIGICGNPNLTPQLILKYNKFPWDFHELSRNPSIKYKVIKAFPRGDWCYDCLSQNPGIKWEDISKNKKNWNIYLLSSNINITQEIIMKNLNVTWSGAGLSKNPNIDINFILKNPSIKWVWPALTINPGIQIRDIMENNLGWDYQKICLNPNLTLDDIIRYGIKPDFELLAQNKFAYDNYLMEKLLNRLIKKRRDFVQKIFIKKWPYDIISHVLEFVYYE